MLTFDAIISERFEDQVIPLRQFIASRILEKLELLSAYPTVTELVRHTSPHVET